MEAMIRSDEELKAKGLQRVYVIEVVEGDVLEDGKIVEEVSTVYRDGELVNVTIVLKDYYYGPLSYGRGDSLIVIKFNPNVDDMR